MEIQNKIDLAGKIFVVSLLALIAYQQHGIKNELAAIYDAARNASESSYRAVMDVRVINKENERIPVDAEISAKRATVGNHSVEISIPVIVKNSGFMDAVPVTVR
jgi:hypothetical protein